MNTRKNLTNKPQGKLRGLQMTTIAIAVSVFVFATVIYFIVRQSDAMLEQEYKKIFPAFRWFAIGIAFVCLGLGFNILQKKSRKLASDNGTLEERLKQYSKVHFKFLALCEGPAMLASIVVLLMGDFRLFVIAGICIIFILYNLPTKKRISQTLQLNWEDQQQL
ncbi:MAG: hypothetical protein R2796_09775 [Chitinophagaceae bacterium]|nr:hypothetical protein [Chitinophagaceae bacterium]MCB0740424.1 hypothetical protein [Chitinophagaceae bacterium]